MNKQVAKTIQNPEFIASLQTEEEVIISKNWLRVLDEIRTFFKKNPDAEF